MIYEHLFTRAGDRQIRAGLIGTGTFGITLFSQAQLIPRLEIPVICDQSREAARYAGRQAGLPAEQIVVCQNRNDVLRAIETGKCAITEDATLMMDTPLDIIVECTGQPEAGARHAELAIQHGKHVAMVNKETDSVIGPMLHHLAQQAGVIYTPVDGDQHGLLIGLVAWARSLGLDVVCGGKAHAREFVYAENSRTVTDGSSALTLRESEMAALHEIQPGEARHIAAARRAILQDLPHIAEADFCESVIAANATGLAPDIPALHGPIVRTVEIPAVLCPKEDGGLLNTQGAIDVVICLRRPDEAGLAGGVFIVISCKNDETWNFLKKKGILVNRQGTHGLIYRPYHLLGVETPLSLLSAGLLKLPTGSLTIEPRVDLVARAARDLKAGSSFDLVDGHLGNAFEPLMMPSVSRTPANPLPFYMIAGNRLTSDVLAGTTLIYDMVDAPPESRLWALRREQDRTFLQES